MSTYRAHVIIDEDGVILLKGAPFSAGDAVEVIVIERRLRSDDDGRYPLRGRAIRYDAPTEPVARRRSNVSS